MNKFFRKRLQTVKQINFKFKSDKEAAILLLICNSKKPEIIFTLRASVLSSHAGEVSFPGGKKDIQDESLLATALRETEEEIGLKSSQIDILGKFLTVPSLKGLKVTCFVGDLGDIRLNELKVNKEEVDYLFTMDLEELYDAQKNAEASDLEFNFRKLDKPIMSWKVPPHKVGGRENIRIWGLTGYLLSEFISQIAYPKATSSL